MLYRTSHLKTVYCPSNHIVNDEANIVQLGNLTNPIENDISTFASSSEGAGIHELFQKREGGNKIDADMSAEMEASGGNNVLPAQNAMEGKNDHAASFTQFMGGSELAINDFFETGYIMANLDGALTSNIAKVLVSTRYVLYVSLCVLAAALATAVGMVVEVANARRKLQHRVESGASQAEE